MSFALYESVIPHQLTSEMQPHSYIDNNNVSGSKQVIPNKDNSDYNTEPVIFEPIRNIKLSRATYKVTSYINFEPYLANFDKFGKYLTSFKEDLTDEKQNGIIDENRTHL